MDSLNVDIQNLEKDTKEIERLFASSLSSGTETRETKSRIAEILANNEQKSQSIRKRLRQLGDENREFKKAHPKNISELKLRVTQHQSIAKRFMVAMQDFEAVQDAHRNAVKGKLEQHLRQMNPDVSPEEIARAVRNGETAGLSSGDAAFAQLPPEERERLQRGLEDLNARNAEIRQLEESIVQLHQLFVDMQIMVEAQGELLNNAEYDIGETKINTQAAHEELVEAREHQKSARKKKCWITVLCVAIVLTIAVGLLIRFAPNWVKKNITDPITGNVGGNSTSPQPPPVAKPNPAPGKITTAKMGRRAGERTVQAVSLTQLLIDNNLIQ